MDRDVLVASGERNPTAGKPASGLSAVSLVYGDARRAFTVLELVVTLTIVGIVAAATVPRISQINTQNKVQRAANALQTEAQQAFALAGRNQRPIKFSWSSTALEVSVTNRAGNVVYRKAGMGKGTFALAASEVTVYPTTLTVFPNGFASDTLYMKVTKSGFTKVVRFTKTGIVRVQ